MRTLRARLLLGTAIGTGLVLSVSALILYTIVCSALWAEFDESLASTARSLGALVEQDGDELEFELGEDSLPEYKPSEHAQYYQFWTSAGNVLTRSPSLGESNLSRSSEGLGVPAYQYAVLPDGRPGRMVQVAVTPRQEERDFLPDRETAQAGLILVVARETLDVDLTLGWLRLLLASGCAGAILASVVVLSWFVQRGLKPLERLATEIAGIGEGDLSSRLNRGDAPTELSPVVTRLNDLLARLETTFARERAFAADVAHELRTPLAGLRATLEVCLTKNRQAEEYRTAVTKSLAVAGQMQRMIENLLELARADAGQLEVANEPVDLVVLLKDCWSQFAKRATERQLEVTWQLPESCFIATDQTKVSLILNNLFANAVTDTNANGQVWIALRPENGQSIVRVSNTGSAVASEDAEKVFNRFWRGDAARSSIGNDRRYGLGLPLCQKLIALLGGSITVSTETNGTFTICLVFSA